MYKFSADLINLDLYASVSEVCNRQYKLTFRKLPMRLLNYSSNRTDKQV